MVEKSLGQTALYYLNYLHSVGVFYLILLTDCPQVENLNIWHFIMS